MCKCGKLIRNAREQQKRSMSELADYCSISLVYLSDIERSRRIPTDERLKQISEFLNLDYVELREARDKERGFVSFDLKNEDPFKINLILRFASLYDSISDEDAKAVIDILKRSDE